MRFWVRRGSYSERVELKRNLSVYGGFEGNESNREERNPDPTRTSIREGEFNNSVVEGAEGAVLDGFTITEGRAFEGGGLRCVGCSMTVRNCRIAGNQTHITITLSCGYGFCVPVAFTGGRGAGVYLENTSSTLNCELRDRNQHSRPRLSPAFRCPRIWHLVGRFDTSFQQLLFYRKRGRRNIYSQGNRGAQWMRITREQGET